MKKIEREGEKKVMLDTEKDFLVWDGEKHYTGQNHPTRWLELYAHEVKDGAAVFYLVHHSQWQGESTYIEKLSLDDAQLFAEEHYEQLEHDDATLKGWGLVDVDAIE